MKIILRFILATACIILMAVSLLTLLFFALEFADPVGSKMADDHDPFGPPTPRSSSLIGIIISSMMCVGSLCGFAKAISYRFDSTLNPSH
jgi:hypothetical protein